MRQDLAVVDDVGPVDEAEGLAHVVVGYQHANAPAGELAHELLDVADGQRVDEIGRARVGKECRL